MPKTSSTLTKVPGTPVSCFEDPRNQEGALQENDSNNQNGNVRWIFQLGVGHPPPPPSLNGHCFQTFFNPHFSFAIESYIYEADFALGQSKISLLSPLPIGSNIDILR